MNKYLHNDTSENEVSRSKSENNESGKLLKKNTATSGKLIIAVYIPYVHDYNNTTSYTYILPNITPWNVQGGTSPLFY